MNELPDWLYNWKSRQPKPSELEMLLLMQKLKKYGRPTYSDTPGMGNMPNWQMGAGRENVRDRPINYKNLPIPQRQLLEQMMMRKELNDWNFFNQTRQPPYYPAGGDWDRLDYPALRTPRT